MLQTATKTLYSLGNLDVTWHDACYNLCAQIPRVIGSASHWQLAQLMYGCARCHLDVPPHTISAIEGRICELHPAGFDGRCASYIMWSYGTLGTHPSKSVSNLMQGRLAHLGTDTGTGKSALNVKDLSMCMWSFGQLSQIATRKGQPKFYVVCILVAAAAWCICVCVRACVCVIRYAG